MTLQYLKTNCTIRQKVRASELTPRHTTFIDNVQRVRTLYVTMAHPASPTNTHFQMTFLLTQLLEALYEGLPV